MKKKIIIKSSAAPQKKKKIYEATYHKNYHCSYSEEAGYHGTRTREGVLGRLQVSFQPRWWSPRYCFSSYVICCMIQFYAL